MNEMSPQVREAQDRLGEAMRDHGQTEAKVAAALDDFMRAVEKAVATTTERTAP